MPPIPTDWRVREIFEEALALPVDVRRSFVARTCEGSVRRQVELLLDSHDDPRSLETPAPQSSSGPGLTRNLEGCRIGPYLLGVRIGASGMGEVYKARDTRLNRTIAIKVLPPQVASEPLARERFERPARWRR